MPMPPYQVMCYRAGCKHDALYKVAARWSDGVAAELKTYGLYCEEHLAEGFAAARTRRDACHLTPGEMLDAPGIYRAERGHRDRALERLPERERELAR